MVNRTESAAEDGPKDGSLKQMTTATGDSLNYTYDALHRLQKVTTKNANGTALFSTAYAFKANGTKTTPLVEYRNVRIGTSGTILEGKKYEYDAVGNITGIYESQLVGNNTERRQLVAYTYDEQNQLLSETNYTYSGTSTTPATTDVYSYTYDTVGNILTEKKNGTVTKTYTYSDGDWKDLLTEFGEGKIAYEGQTYTKSTNTVSGTPTSGNPISYANGKALYSFDWVNGRRLQTAHVDGADLHQVTYRYDADGIRLLKNVDGTLHDYITQNGKVVRETIGNGTNAEALDFIYDESGRPFALKYTNGSAVPETYYYVLNLQGDVVALIDEEYNYVAQYTYNAWGEIITSSGTMAEINPLRYRGYYYDNETGFYYLQSRYYDPVTHRFINADSYASTGHGIIGTNMFAYCNNSPVASIDQAGRMAQEATTQKYQFSTYERLAVGGGGGGALIFILSWDSLKTIGNILIFPVVAPAKVTYFAGVRICEEIEEKVCVAAVERSKRSQAIYYPATTASKDTPLLVVYTKPMLFEEAYAWALAQKAGNAYTRNEAWGLYTENARDAMAMAFALGGELSPQWDKATNPGHYNHYHTSNHKLGRYRHFHVWYGSPM